MVKVRLFHRDERNEKSIGERYKGQAIIYRVLGVSRLYMSGMVFLLPKCMKKGLTRASKRYVDSCLV